MDENQRKEREEIARLVEALTPCEQRQVYWYLRWRQLRNKIRNIPMRWLEWQARKEK